jgi:hypothetical protein
MIVTHTYLVEGTFTVTLTVTDNDGLTDTAMAYVTVRYPTLSIKLSGEFDYLHREDVKIRVAALVRYADIMEPVSNANVTIEIYDPYGTLWISDMMVERLPGTGIYMWESNETIRELRLEKGVYLVHVRASFQEGPTTSDILMFHIDPPAEESSIPIYSYVIAISVVLVVVLGLILLKRPIYSRFRRAVQ